MQSCPISVEGDKKKKKKCGSCLAMTSVTGALHHPDPHPQRLQSACVNTRDGPPETSTSNKEKEQHPCVIAGSAGYNRLPPH